MTSLGLLVGGLGLFLLGMSMMTDGLKLAAGAALDRILTAATRTRWHALGSGALMTALVQSSSAVTVAAIGFVNAGLLSLAPALWVLFGANVGTTMTGWIVALVGLKFQVETLALPLVGAGVLLRLGGEHQRRGALGSALAGFGLLFLGIATLQQSFAGLADQIRLPQGADVPTVLAQLGFGTLMTVLMQSSSASMTMALTAAQGGLLDLQGAAAVVIGANVGTTVTALLAAIGATPNARRAAAAHVVFNLLTGGVALLLLPWLISALGSARLALGLPSDPAAKLALFHTTFNLIGVALMWPLAARLTRWLQQRFRAGEDDEAQPRHLDANVLAVPSLAVDALALEVGRIGQIAARVLRAVLAGAGPDTLARDLVVVAQLNRAADAFVERMNLSAMSQQDSEELATVLRIQRYHASSIERALASAPLPGTRGADAVVADRHGDLVASIDAVLSQFDAAGGAARQVDTRPVDLAYEALKAAVLSAGAAGRLPLVEMEAALRHYSALRRATHQAVKARERPLPMNTR